MPARLSNEEKEARRLEKAAVAARKIADNSGAEEDDLLATEAENKAKDARKLADALAKENDPDSESVDVPEGEEDPSEGLEKRLFSCKVPGYTLPLPEKLGETYTALRGKVNLVFSAKDPIVELDPNGEKAKLLSIGDGIRELIKWIESHPRYKQELIFSIETKEQARYARELQAQKDRVKHYRDAYKDGFSIDLGKSTPEQLVDFALKVGARVKNQRTQEPLTVGEVKRNIEQIINPFYEED